MCEELPSSLVGVHMYVLGIYLLCAYVACVPQSPRACVFRERVCSHLPQFS